MMIRQRWSENNLTGELRNWRRAGVFTIRGRVYNHPAFEDGTYIPIMFSQEIEYKDHWIFITGNSEYFKANKLHEMDRA